MSEGKQEAREHNVNPQTDRCVMCGRNAFQRGWGPECPYPQPQGKAQPDNGDKLHDFENGFQAGVRKQAAADKAAFQRGQQAMAEKAAQLAKSESETYDPTTLSGQLARGVCLRVAALIRSLASAEPPQDKLRELVKLMRQEGDTQETTGFANSARLARQFASMLEAALRPAESLQGEAEKEGRT